MGFEVFGEFEYVLDVCLVRMGYELVENAWEMWEECAGGIGEFGECDEVVGESGFVKVLAIGDVSVGAQHVVVGFIEFV